MTITELLARDGQAPNDPATEPAVVEYLDLDGDGVPDAVHTRHTVACDRTGDGFPDTVQVVDEVAAAIGIDGVPHRVETWIRSS